MKELREQIESALYFIDDPHPDPDESRAARDILQNIIDNWNTRTDEWISVERTDKLPKNKDGVYDFLGCLVNMKNGHREIKSVSYFTYEDGSSFWDTGLHQYKITHYQPLPTPPKG